MPFEILPAGAAVQLVTAGPVEAGRRSATVPARSRGSWRRFRRRRRGFLPDAGRPSAEDRTGLDQQRLDGGLLSGGALDVGRRDEEVVQQPLTRALVLALVLQHEAQ